MAEFDRLPDDVRAYLKQADQEGDVTSEAVLAAIGVSIGKLRDEAKEARITSGIEERWREAEEAYAGIDDANRGEVNGGSQWTKSMSKDGPISSDEVAETSNRSTLYVRMTQRYVDAGTAKLGEILLAPGAKSFGFSATPVPDLIDAKDDNRPVLLDHLPGSPPAMVAADDTGATPGGVSPTPSVPVPAPAGIPPAGAVGGLPGAVAAAIGGGAAGPAAGPPGPPGAPPGPFPPGVMNGQQPGPPLRPLTAADLAQEKMEQAEESAKKAEKRIYDWHVECRRTSHVRKVIFDSGRLGVGVLKGPFPQSSRQMATRKGADGIELGIRKVVLPGSKWVNAWNFFPDPSCGEDVQDGDFCFEREWMGERAVRKLKQLPGYIASQIDKVLLEGPQKVNVKEAGRAPDSPDTTQLKKGKYETWYFHGTLTREEMGCICEMAGPQTASKFNESVPAEKQQVYAIVTMINDSVVKATVNPLDSGDFPYHTMPWQRRTGSWAGVGIGEQIATPQKMLTAAVRSMLDNAGISAGGQIVIDTGIITPADGEMGMSPHKIWYLNGDGERLDVKQAFGLFRIDNVTAELMQVVELALKLGEEATSIPLVTQGQSGPTTPDTFGAAQLQNNNANQLLRSIGYTFDDHITEPETRQYYEWLILDPDVPEDEKGDWTIDAHGSSALVQQALQDQFIPTLAAMVLNPAYGLSPKRWAEMLVRAKQLQPKDFQYTEEEQAKMDAAPPPSPPAVQVAQIRAQTDQAKLALDQQTAQADDAFDKDKLHTESLVQLHNIKSNYELALLEYSNKNSVTLEQVKAELAKTAMQLQTEERLNAANQAHEAGQNANKQSHEARQELRRAARGPQQKPPVQAPGRARNGQAFSQVTG